MNKPLTSWQKTLRSLGYKVNWNVFFRSKNKAAPKRRQVKRLQQKLGFESLEPRQLLAVVTDYGFDPTTNALTVVGTNTEDTISISVSGNDLVEVGSLETNIDPATVSSILVNGLDGNDEIDLSGVDPAVFTELDLTEIFGGGGDDTIDGSDGNDIIFGDNQEVLLGDVNQDGTFDFLDISPFINAQSAGDYLAEADINLDGSVSFLDISPFVTQFSNPNNQEPVVVDGGAGIDIIRGGDGDDTIFGDAGNDTIFGDNRQVLLGDVNQNGAVDFLDISPFINALSAGDFIPEADINRNGSVNFLDISPFIQILADPDNQELTTVAGGAGSDVIEGGDGDDVILGDAGDDVISGGAGVNVLEGCLLYTSPSPRDS